MGTVRTALRSLSKDPVTATFAVVTLGLAVGAATAIISLVDAVLVEPLPFADVARLHHLRAVNPEVADEEGGVSYPDLLDWERSGGTGVELAGYYGYSAVWTGEDVPRRLLVGYTSLNFFSVLGVDPLLGSAYSAEPDRGLAPASPNLNPESVAVISDAFWRRALGANREVVDRTVLIDGQLRRILGVMPSSIGMPGPDVDAWLPWRLSQQRRNDRFLGVVARLPDTTRPTDALAGLRSTAAGLAEQFPDTNAGWSVDMRPLRDLLLADFERPMWVLSAAVFLLLAVAAANVAGLLLARNWRRSREIAVRRALGAPPWKIARGLLAESTLLALAAAAVGLPVGRLLFRFVPLLGIDLPLRGDPAMDSGVLWISAGLALLAGLVAGLTPSVQASRQDPITALHAGGRGGIDKANLRLRAGLVAAQAALVTVLLVGAGLLLGSFVRLTRVPHGFDSTNVVVGRIELEPGAAASGEARVAFFDNLLAELDARPEVIAAGATTVLPMASSGTDFNRPYWRDGEPNPGGTAPEADIRMVSPGYFRALGIPLLAGRDFGPADRFDGPGFRAGERVVIVNRSLAERTWPGVDAVGQRLVMDYPRQVYVYAVVGVVDDALYYGPRSAARPEAYIPYAQNPYPGMSVVVRVAADPLAMVARLPALVADLNPAQPVSDVVPFAQLTSAAVQRERLLFSLIGAFGLLALLVAMVGVYGLVASNVAGRTRELGIRLAIGARGAELVRGMQLEMIRVAGAGVAAGILLALLLAGFLGELLYQTDPADPLILAAVAVLLLAVVAFAALVPARRVTRIDPMGALRQE